MSSPTSPQGPRHDDAPMGNASHDPSLDRAKLLDHEYDGIRELDNPTPGWWHAIFIGTALFSVLYFAFFHLSPVSWSITDTWNRKQVAINRQVFGKLGTLEPNEASIVKLANDAQLMGVGRSMFVSNCASCHGNDGGGINGVNLTDDSYKNVRQLLDIYTVITKGAANGAMPAHEQRMSQNERLLLAAYTAMLRGTTPAGGRPPEGEAIPPFPMGKSASR